MSTETLERRVDPRSPESIDGYAETFRLEKNREARVEEALAKIGDPATERMIRQAVANQETGPVIENDAEYADAA